MPTTNNVSSNSSLLSSIQTSGGVSSLKQRPPSPVQQSDPRNDLLASIRNAGIASLKKTTTNDTSKLEKKSPEADSGDGENTMAALLKNALNNVRLANDSDEEVDDDDDDW